MAVVIAVGVVASSSRSRGGLYDRPMLFHLDKPPKRFTTSTEGEERERNKRKRQSRL